MIGDCNLTDSCNNKFIGNVLKSNLFYDNCRSIIWQGCNLDLSTLSKAYFKLIQWPKAKGTHFTVINRIYPVAEFQNLSLWCRISVPSCNNDDDDETIEHLFFFLCPIKHCFWSDIKNWISLKINDVPSFESYHVIPLDGNPFYEVRIVQGVNLPPNHILILCDFVLLKRIWE